MVSRPTTPDSNATSLGNVSGEDEFPPEVKGTFEIRLASGRTMICHFDGDTSAAGALRQALENQDWFAPGEGPPPNGYLVKGTEPVQFLDTLVCDLFDGHEEGARVLTLVLTSECESESESER